MKSKKNQFACIIKFNPKTFIFYLLSSRSSILQQHLSLTSFPIILFKIYFILHNNGWFDFRFPWLMILLCLCYLSHSFFSFHQQGKFTIELVSMLNVCNMCIFNSFYIEYKPTFHVISTEISPIKQWFFSHIPI